MKTASPTSSRPSPPAGVIEPHVKRIAVVVVLGSIMSIVDTTIVNIALESLSRDLRTPLNNVQWVVTAYLLALAAVIPLSAWAVRRYSAFRVYMSALVLFTAGSALCGLATSLPELVVFRALQGVGGGLLVPTGMTILVQAVGRDNLAKVMSVIGVPTVLAPVFGPTLGGLLLQSVGWHSIFLVNVPIGILTFLVARKLLPRDRAEKAEAGPLDWPGLVLAGAGTVGITYGLSESATAGTFRSASVVLPIIAGLLLLVGFVARTGRARRPLLDLRLYRIQAFSAASLVMFCLGGAMFGAMILLPLYFQVARHLDPIQTGLLLIPQGLGSAVGMNRSAQATRRFGAGLTSVWGGIILAAATVPFLFVTATTSDFFLSVVMIVRGVGVGLAILPAMTAAFSALSHDQVNDASPQLNVIQRVGASLGTAVIAVILQGKLVHLGAHATSAAVAGSFAQTYAWVLILVLAAIVPTAYLWRIERRNTATEYLDTSEELLIEAVA